jgi:hypothetical protein
MIKAAVVAYSLLNTIISCAAPEVPRVHRLLRGVLLVVQQRNARKVFLSIVSAVPAIAQACGLLSFLLIFFGTFAFVLFAGNMHLAYYRV